MKKFLDKYRMMSKPTKASLWFILSNVVLKGISFITLPIFSRLLSTSEYGITSVYSSWVTTVSVITTLTIWGGVFNVWMVKYSDRSKQLISSFQGLATTITALFFVVSCFFLKPLSTLFGIPEYLIVCMYIEILAQIPFSIWSTEQRYRFEYKKLIFITVAIAILNPILGYFAVINTEYKAEARILSNLVIHLAIGIVLFAKNMLAGKVYFNKQFWKFGFCFNVVLIPHYLSTQVLNQSDRLMINSICGSSDAGIYSVAYNFALLLSLVTNGVNSSLTPHIYQSLKDRQTDKLAKQTTGVVLLVALLAVGLIAFVPDLFTFMLPESYYPALRVLPPVTVGAYFLFLYPLFGSVEFYYEENRYVTIASVVGAILNVVLNYIFIPVFGFIAAAYTTLFCYMCFSVCHFYFMQKILKKNGTNVKIYDIKLIAVISAALIAVMILMLFLYNHFVVRWGIILLIFIILVVKRREMSSLVRNMTKK